MKVALCLSGQSRFVEEGFNSFKNKLVNFDQFDIFIHTWKDNQYEKVLPLYSPVSYICEPQRKDITLGEKNISFVQQPAKSGNFVHYSMFYSMMTANKLKIEYENENNFKYDCVIRSRFDVALFDTLDVFDYDLEKVNSPNVVRKNPDAISDWLNFSNSYNMDIHADAYYDMPEYSKKYKIIRSGENIITYKLNKEKIATEKIEIDIRLIRSFKTPIKNWIYVNDL